MRKQCGIVSLGVFQDSGGPTKTIASFKKALDAQLFSFCDRNTLREKNLIVEGAKPVVSSGFLGLRQFCFSANETAKYAETQLASSNLISCHSFYRYHNYWVQKLAARYEIPYWFVPHGILDPWVMSYGKIGKQIFWCFIGKRFLRNASAVIFSTTAEKEKAQKHFSIPKAEIVHWPVGLVDLGRRRSLREKIRLELNIPNDAKVLLYFGRLHSMKRPLETIEAVSKISSKKLHLIIVGNNQDITVESCRERSISMNIEDRVHVIGPVYGDQKYHYLFASDAYISLSYRENFNHTAAESLSAQLPVILSPGNDLAGDLKHVNCVWELDGNDCESIIKGIEEFCHLSHEELDQMGVLGRAWVAKNLSFRNFESRLLDLADIYGSPAGIR